MRICDVVKNSVWYDPRVRKQLLEYAAHPQADVVCVGLKDVRFRQKDVDALPCPVILADAIQPKKRSIFGKIHRELSTNRAIYKAIVNAAPDVIHANDLNALIPAYKARKKLGCRLIYDTHEIFTENPWIARNPLVKAVWSFFERKIIRKVDLVVCVSHAAGRYLQKKYDIPAPMVVTNCIRAAEQCFDSPKAEQKELLNHGQFYEGRGYETMIQAAPLLADLPDLQVVIRGLGPKEDELKALAEETAAPNFRFDPPVKVNELVPAAARAWAGVAITEAISLNFKLSVSNKLFEYAAAGLPIIMSDIPEHRYLNDIYNFGIILENDSPEALAKAAQQLYEDPDLYVKCAAGSVRMSKEINWEADFAKLIAAEVKLCSR